MQAMFNVRAGAKKLNGSLAT